MLINVSLVYPRKVLGVLTNQSSRIIIGAGFLMFSMSFRESSVCSITGIYFSKYFLFHVAWNETELSLSHRIIMV